MMSFKNLKLLVLDNDDVLFNSSPLIQYHVERNWPQFNSRILKQRERAISVVQYQYDQAIKEVQRAQERHEIPNLPNFNINRNDVIRTEDEMIVDFEDRYYRNPINELGEVLAMVKFDKEMFLENRDATVEADGKLSIENGLIPYHEIYREANWFPYTMENVRKLHNTFGDRLISLTAHNGINDTNGREFEAKGEAVHKMVPEMQHYGLRFHATEHIEGERRPKNSKAKKLMQLYNLDDLRGVVIVDDSLDNCVEIYNHGGTPILLRNIKSQNEYGFSMVRSTKPESIYRELERNGYTSDNEEDILQKPKQLIK